MNKLLFIILFISTQLFADITQRNYFFEFKISSYYPKIDSEFSSDSGVKTATPYKDIFGGDSIFPLYQINFDFQLYNKELGTISIGSGLGYGNVAGKGRTPDGTETNDDTKFHLIPVNINIYYQFDYLAFHYNIPFIPYVRGGLIYDFWWFTNGVGNISEYQDKDMNSSIGYGGTAGFFGTVGMKLLLDVFAPGMARSFDIDFGVNNSYLFADYTWAIVNDFWSDSSFELGSDYFSFGIAFDF